MNTRFLRRLVVVWQCGYAYPFDSPKRDLRKTTIAEYSGAFQFVVFAFRLVSGTRAIIKSESGLASDANTLDAIARDAKGLSDTLTASPALASSNTTLQELVGECRTIADNLLAALGKLRANKAKKWSCFIAALRTVWSKGNIDGFFDRLGKVQAQISTHMHFLLLEYLNKQSVQIHTLRENAQRPGMEGHGRIEDLRNAVITRLERLSQETSKTQEDMRHLMDNLKPDAPRSAATHPPRFGLSLDPTNYFSGWIFQPSVPDGSKTISFDKWLREGSGTFWIHGKAGSGKSTLMKFICSHETTVESLREWAGSKRFITAEFLFWNSGTVLRKSREGLLRSLLFEILRECPELIPQVSKDNQKCTFRKRSPNSHADDEELWSQEELMEAYRNLVTCCDEVDVKFCFFIDGLDEFEEKSKTHCDLIATLRILDVSQNIKFCVSSRPWTVFSDVFGEDPDRLLKLEDLTRDDIRNYVHEMFNKNSQFRLLGADNLHYAGLIEDITSRAQGVFLWVFLVAQSRRLHATNGSHAMDGYIGTAAAVPNSLLATRRRLDGRCKGLREVVLDEPDVGSYFECKVDFLHRTVRDFLLESPNIRQILEQKRFVDLNGVGSCNIWLLPSLSILAALKSATFRTEPQAAAIDVTTVETLLESLMIFAHEAQTNMTDCSGLIRMLCDAETTYFKRQLQFSWALDRDIFLELACQAQLFSYIEQRIRPGWFIEPPAVGNSTVQVSRSKPISALLSYALAACEWNRLGNSSQALHPRIIQHLLDMSAGPDEPVKAQRPTIWRIPEAWSSEPTDSWGIPEIHWSLLIGGTLAESVRRLLKQGAELNSVTFMDDGRRTTIRQLVEEILNGEIREFQGERKPERSKPKKRAPRPEDGPKPGESRKFRFKTKRRPEDGLEYIKLGPSLFLAVCLLGLDPVLDSSPNRCG
ncbi:hypothetical protein F4859DRAFT_514504 [Xylaria cf. heliscus]|nr:hypothetical protein F4859DRAFT_514504 [Xylaria cf. heliscus]